MKLWLQLDQVGSKKMFSFVEKYGLELEAEALTFLKNCVRQNSTNLMDNIRVEEHIGHPAFVCLPYVLETTRIRVYLFSDILTMNI